MAVNKSDLVDEVANRTGVTKKVAKIVIDTLLQVTTDALSIGKQVEWPGLGEFFVVTKGINPMTGAKLTIPKTIIFVPEDEEF